MQWVVHEPSDDVLDQRLDARVVRGEVQHYAGADEAEHEHRYLGADVLVAERKKVRLVVPKRKKNCRKSLV